MTDEPKHAEPKHGEPKQLTDPDEREEQLTRAPKSDPEDADPRVELSTGTGGATRIDVADTAVVRPGKPDEEVEDPSGD